MTEPQSLAEFSLGVTEMLRSLVHFFAVRIL